jgi:hypothetical protein
MALFLLQCSRIEEWLPFAICYHYCTGPGWELNRSFSLVEVLMPSPIHYPHSDVSPTSGRPTATPHVRPPQAVKPYRIRIPPFESTRRLDESLCRWNNLHRAHVRDFFNFSIRTSHHQSILGRALAGKMHLPRCKTDFAQSFH